jgi:hypothetical protein
MWIFWVIVVLRSNVIYESLTSRDFAIIELPREPLVSFLAAVMVARDRVHLEARALARLLSSPHLARIVVAMRMPIGVNKGDLGSRRIGTSGNGSRRNHGRDTPPRGQRLLHDHFPLAVYLWRPMPRPFHRDRHGRRKSIEQTSAAGHLIARLGQSLRPEAGHERGSFYAPSCSPASFRRAKSTSRSR